MRRRLLSASGLSLLLLATMLPASVAGAEPERFGRLNERYRVDPGLAADLLKLRDLQRPIQVFVELNRPSVAESIGPRIDAGEDVSEPQREVLRAPMRQEQAAVRNSIERMSGRVEGVFTDALNGFRVSIPARNVNQLARLFGVKSVHRVGLAVPHNDNSARYMQVHKTWSQTGFTGQGVRVAVIDTGINYYHRDFNGKGDAANNADNPNVVEPGTFPTAKVVAGHDFVGDDYNPSDDDPSNDEPQPDRDPKDCDGHGTHVAGTAAGVGVRSNGTSYSGPYNSNALKNTAWNVPPGMAPRASLMAYKVFGCGGGTYVVLDAIERAVRDGADVINMSLGLDFGHGGRIEDMATDNAVRAGVVVVASIGNSGPSAYIGGSPGTADGAIAVAAMDADPSYPSVWIDMPTGADIRGLLANDNTNGLPVTGDLNVFQDNPATPCDGDTGEGCEESGTFPDSYIYNAYVDGQIPVVFRGSGARVDRAKQGDAQGAPAVIMVNNSDGFPPYEGPIAGADIPFVGVPSSTASRFAADEGDPATIKIAPDLANPNFGKKADFSSGGFRRGNRALKPDVIAPGVSVFSADTNNMTGAVGISGTSMASPAVAGVAALVREAFPTLPARAVKSQIVNTSNPNKIDPGSLRLVGAGVVDALKATRSRAHISVPGAQDEVDESFQTSIAFGLHELTRATTDPTLSTTRGFRIWNRSSKSITYNISNVWDQGPMGATVEISPSTITVPANTDRLVTVTIRMTNAAAAQLSRAAPFHGPVVDVDSYGQLHLPLEYIGGRLLVKPTRTSASVVPLRVPWAVVPRAVSNVWGTLGSYSSSGSDRNATLTVRNSQGSLQTGYADIFQWGLMDQREGYDGMDIRAAGFQTLPASICDSSASSSDRCLNVAINNWTRFGNASENAWIVPIDTNNDGQDDYEVWGLDAALLLGALEGVFISAVYDIDAAEFTFLYLATAPANGSTVMLPFLASDIGLSSSGNRTFKYYAVGIDIWDDDGDPGNPVFHQDLALTGSHPGTASQVAHYNAFDPVLSNGQFVELDPEEQAAIPLTLDRGRYDAKGGMKGWLLVSLDDLSGERQADMIPVGNVP